MTVLCIVIAVFLVTVVFSMTDMLMRAELSHQVDKNGSWHLMFEDISDCREAVFVFQMIEIT